MDAKMDVRDVQVALDVLVVEMHAQLVVAVVVGVVQVALTSVMGVMGVLVVVLVAQMAVILLVIHLVMEDVLVNAKTTVLLDAQEHAIMDAPQLMLHK